MIHPALKGRSMHFICDKRPDLLTAICTRLRDLGLKNTGFDANPNIIMVEPNGTYITSKVQLAYFDPDPSFTLSTIENLYDLPAPLQLEVGKWYWDRDGQAVRVVAFNSEQSTFSAQFTARSGRSLFTRFYYSSGKWTGNDYDVFDLVEEATKLPIILADGVVVEIPVAEHERLRGVK